MQILFIIFLKLTNLIFNFFKKAKSLVLMWTKSSLHSEKSYYVPRSDSYPKIPHANKIAPRLAPSTETTRPRRRNEP
jgi:hypothetical protein